MQETVSHASGFSFQLIALRDYIRKDGTPTQIKVWRAHCDKCQAPFEVTTPLGVASIEQSSAFSKRRCQDHKVTKTERKRFLSKARAVRRAKHDDKITP
jgi:hypothetical protein